MWKEHDVVMLSTNEKAIYPSVDTYLERLSLSEFRNGSKRLSFNRYSDGRDFINPQHLYITSDEEIKEGDWRVVFLEHNCITPIGVNQEGVGKKIIATTDRSLSIHWNKQDYKSLPFIPQSFITHYITEYNKGNVITKVMIEYNIIPFSKDAPDRDRGDGSIRINSDNTINIKSIKENWKRREVSNLIFKFKDTIAMELGISADKGVFEFKKIMNWINKNL